jgi:hypothetical protein
VENFNIIKDSKNWYSQLLCILLVRKRKEAIEQDLSFF